MMAALKQLSARIAMVLVRGTLKLVDDSQKLQVLQVGLFGQETRGNLERFQEYGFSSHAKPGAEILAASLGGNRDHTVIISVDDRRFRLKSMAEGEVALYDDLGQFIHLKRNGVEIQGINLTFTELNAGAGKITLNANEMEVNAATKFVLNCPDVHLGGEGGPQVARIGDHVDTNSLIDTGSAVVRSI